jgi:branched-chain amino acid aminotransferase
VSAHPDKCSFCGEPASKARMLVEGRDGAWICESCVAFSSAMISDAGGGPIGVIPGDVERQKSLLLRTSASALQTRTGTGDTFEVKKAGVVPGAGAEDRTEVKAKPGTPPPATPAATQVRPRTSARIEMPSIDSGAAAAGFMVNLDGSIYPGERAVVPLFDRGFLYGDSVYETIRAYGGVPFALGEHLTRLYNSMRRLRITPNVERDTIEARVEGTLAAASVRDAYIRIIVTRGPGPEFGLASSLDNPGPVYVLVKAYKPPPREWYEKGIAAIIPVTRRVSRGALDPAIKSGNYLNSILAMIEAKEAGADDAILLNEHGMVTEATTSSVFAVIDGVVVTPPLSAGILEGITRRHLLAALRDAGQPPAELNLTEADLKRATELFVTSTLKEVVAIRTLDGAPVGVPAPGPVTQACAALLSKRIRKLIA